MPQFQRVETTQLDGSPRNHGIGWVGKFAGNHGWYMFVLPKKYRCVHVILQPANNHG